MIPLTVKFQQVEEHLTLSDLPSEPTGGLPQVFEIIFDLLEINGKIISTKKAPVINISKYGRTILDANLAEFTGYGVKGFVLKVETIPDDKYSFNNGWFTPEQKAFWKVESEKEGEYRLSVSLACPVRLGGSLIKIKINDTELIKEMSETYSVEWHQENKIKKYLFIIYFLIYF